LLWSAVASSTLRLRTTPIFKGQLQQGFATGEMGFNDKFVRFGSWPLSNSGRALALSATDAAALGLKRTSAQ
jgi:hypothetical protein